MISCLNKLNSIYFFLMITEEGVRVNGESENVEEEDKLREYIVKQGPDDQR